MTDSKRNTKEKVFIAMGIIALGSNVLLGFMAFPVIFTTCGIIGLVYGIRSKDIRFTRWSSLSLLIGVGMVIYTLLLINSM